ncbi:TetR/AcrR family transcriptional regulator [Goodfellowiella coeruleoviolacea]|uniref:Transcriptional regulator, TetR family n=1 Tax=Goodfellowiella coeruleoviolacea TaxID=334858 RepID=A0AAE3GG70_9PSEU|nr:TetR/AcrR family transcriptional regulator [Goodfellowiella coeruleoviolacea]MCP2166764.1 transcriptional regulator, TetR family [Goodfellowiella coeruleoviolacea]
MARTKEFDPDAALDAAMELFWARGYESTSTADLVEHLGIARASLYATFGSKHELYLRAFDRYLQATDSNVVGMLSRPGPALPAVRELVERYAHEALRDPDRRGCLVVNAAVERMATDPDTARKVEASWRTLEVALTSALLRARAQGELPEGAEPAALARFLLVFLQGIRVMSRGAPDEVRLRDAVRQALRVLD